MGVASANLLGRLVAASIAVAGLGVFVRSLLTVLHGASPGLAALYGSAAALLGLTAWRLPWDRFVTRGAMAARVGDLEALVGAVALLQAENQRGRIADLIARLGAAVLHAEDATVFLHGGSGGLATAGRHEPPGSVPSGIAPRDAAVTRAADTGRVVLVRDRRAVPGVEPSWLLCVPLLGAANRTQGVVVLRSGRPDRWNDPFTAHLAQLFGFQAGLALERLRVIEHLADQALRDPLTGVGNRRRAAELIGSLQPGDALVLLDLDGFKRVNDTRGHDAGDTVLSDLGRYLARGLRDQDAVARYGGDEFVLVLRGAGDGATPAAERLVAGWRELRPPATFSAGLAVHGSDDTSRSTLRRADRALYAAKHAGRDRVLPFRPEIVQAS